MKIVKGKTGLMFRLGAMVAVLLLGQQAMAEGTRAGQVIANTASVAFDVNSNTQTAEPSNTVSFVVDRRVAYTLVPVSTPDLEIVNPGQDDAFADFLLTNTSNSDLDFVFVLAQMAGGSVDTLGADTADMGLVDYDVETGVWPPARGGGAAFADDLAADDSVRIRVWGDAALTMTNGQIAGVELTATAEDTAGGALAYGVANDDTLQNVDVNDPDGSLNIDGVRVSNDGFIVEAADLTVVKTVTLIDGDLGSGLMIPGVRLQYDIVVTNAASSATADAVVISDSIAGDLTFLTGAGGSDFTDIEYSDNGAAFVACSADAAAGDTDGCSLDGASLVVGNANLVISLAATETFAIRFQALINDPATTP